MTDLQHLPPQSRAVLSLILQQGKKFDEIAELLHMDRFDVRSRAHNAAMRLVPAPAGMRQDERGSVLDYLLGEESVSARVRVRGQLREPGKMREWAIALEEKLAPLAAEPLPAIPEPAEAEAEARPRRWRLFFTVMTIVGVGLVGVALLAGSGSTRHPPGRAIAARSAGAHPGGASTIQPLRRLVLAPTGSDPSALGAGAIVRQGASLLLLLQARGLTPNHGDTYAVWLFNNSIDARLLGFVSPLVGPTGTFSSGVALPDDAIRFHSLIITRETSNRPVSPGQTVLHSPLALS